MSTQIAQRHRFLKSLNSPLTIGFTAIADFSSFIGQEYLSGIMKASSDYGINFINMASAIRHSIFSDTEFIAQYFSKLNFMRPPLLDGLITWASSLCEFLPSQKILDTFSSLSPLPMVDIGYLDIPGVPSIRIDNEYSINLLVEHLVKTHGFSRIAFIGSNYSHPHLERLEKFKKAMQGFGLSVEENSIFMSPSLASRDIEEQAERFLAIHQESILRQSPAAIQAIVTSSDIIACAVVETLEKHSVSVPDMVSVTGFNNQLAGITSPSPITTIDLAYFKRGYEAVELLLDRIMDKEVPRYARNDRIARNDGLARHTQNTRNDWQAEIRTVKTSLIVRQSCGCFEKSIIDAEYCTAFPEDFYTDDSEPSHEKIHLYLTANISHLFIHEAEKEQEELVESILSDIYNTSVPPPVPNILVWFRSYLKRNRFSPSHISSLPEKISELRRIVLPLLQNDFEQRTRIEDIFHALRALHSVNERYEIIAHRGESYFNSKIAEIALNLANVETIKQIDSILRFKLSELSIPGIILCLSPYLSEELGETSIKTVIPENQEHFEKLLPLKVREPASFPKKFFAGKTSFSATLELLWHNSRYIGYAYILNNGVNMALYDDIKELLSQCIYKIYKKEGKSRPFSLVVANRQKLIEKIPIEQEFSEDSQGKFNSQAIMDYLVDHLDEMCDLDKMAAFFNMSKSHLIRRTRELTGYTAQTLLELLKIEQAKNLIKSGKMKMNDIAKRLGFSNPNYFSNVFLKVTGSRPSEWARQNTSK